MYRTFFCLLLCVMIVAIDLDDPHLNEPGYLEHILSTEHNYTSLTQLFEAASDYRIKHDIPAPTYDPTSTDYVAAPLLDFEISD